MRSLAITVLILIFIMIVSGISSIWLSFFKTKPLSNVTLKPFQRLLTIFLATISLVIGIQFATQVNSFGGRVIGGFGIATALIAFYRVIKK